MSEKADKTEKKPPNWVAARAGCTIEGAFQDLMKRVREDVDQANVFPHVKLGRTFDVKNGASGSFTVYAFRQTPSNRDRHEVLFYRSSKTIVFRKNETKEIAIVPGWNDEKNKCEFLVGESTLEIWQISKMALCEFFFGDD